ncbi:hypothetical protein RYX36_037142 [Vicia faba]
MQLHAMETRSSKRKKLAQIEQQNDAKKTPPTDQISDLPDAVIHQILLLLPIKCVAQMSVLSKRWKFLWTTFPDLDFTTLNPFPFVSTKPRKKATNFAKCNHPLSSQKLDFITQVLSIRDAKQKDIRVLCFRARLGFSRLNSLIRNAIRHNIRELDIEVETEFQTDDFFNFPRCIIGSESLQVLKLKSGFRLPPSSIMRNGFQSLHTLSLSLIILYNQPCLSDMFNESSFPVLRNLRLDLCFGLTYIRVACRALEDLNLERCYQLQGLDVCGAKIERMRVTSCFDAFCSKTWVRMNVPKLENLVWKFNAVTDVAVFENSNLLNEASIGFFMLKEGKVNMGRLQSAINFFSGLSHAHSLTLENQTIEILSKYNVFLQPFYNLKSLEIHTGLKKRNVQALAFLFRSSPILNTLILKIIDDDLGERKQWNRDLWDMTNTEEEKYWESQIPSLKSFLQHLKVVKIQGFLDCANEVTLTKFLLKQGKVLEKMILRRGYSYTRDTLRRQKIRSQMMGFSWASSNAKVEFQ